MDLNIESLSDSQVAAAAALDVYLEHASVGGNLSAGLDNLESSNSRYDRSRMVFISRGNPSAMDKIDDFYDNVTSGTADPSSYGAMMMKLCYIDNACGGFTNETEMFQHYRDRMNALEAAYPGTVFVWWTIPLETTGDAVRDNFNSLVRNYCAANGKVLYDIAAIESHEADGTPHFNGGYEALVDAYTTDGGHPNTAYAMERLARGFWMLAWGVSRR